MLARGRPLSGEWLACRLICTAAVGCLAVALGSSSALANGLIAKPGGPYKVERGGKVTLDGSGSVEPEKGVIKKWVWTFEVRASDYCPGGAQTTKRGQKVSIVVLCDVTATLKVSNAGGYSHEDSTMVNVKARQNRWQATPFNRTVVTDDRSGFEAPSATKLSQGLAEVHGVLLGDNTGKCGERRDSDRLLSPCRYEHGWLGRGYELQEVSDRNGPFDGWSYTVDPRISVHRIERLNPFVLEGSEFYKKNERKGAPIGRFITALRQHEGLGTRSNRTGHSQIIRAEIRKRTTNPRRILEQIVAPRRAAARAKADSALTDIEMRVLRASADPLPQIWSGDLWVKTNEHDWIEALFSI